MEKRKKQARLFAGRHGPVSERPVKEERWLVVSVGVSLTISTGISIGIRTFSETFSRIVLAPVKHGLEVFYCWSFCHGLS